MPSQSHYQTFQQSAARHGDHIAVRSADGDISYSQLAEVSRNVARALMAMGANRGDRIAIWGINSAQWIIAALAIQAVGGVLVPLGTRLRAREVKGIADDGGVSIAFCDSGFAGYDYVEALKSAEVGSLRQIIVMDDNGPDGVQTLARMMADGAAINDADLDARIAQGSGDDLADIIFTSGTTGKPKGVPMTCEQSLTACAVQQSDIARFTKDDVFTVSFPFAHNAGYAGGFFRSDLAQDDRPDIQCLFITFSTTKMGDQLHPFSGFTVSACPLRPTSRGHVHAISPDIATPPEILANFLSTEEDQREIVAGMGIIRNIMAQPAMAGHVAEEHWPGPAVVDDAAMLVYARETGGSIYHASCTTAMGKVVGSSLRVIGIDGLRVVDASIMPSVVSGNTNAAVIAIAEKAADMIRTERKG